MRNQSNLILSDTALTVINTMAGNTPPRRQSSIREYSMTCESILKIVNSYDFCGPNIAVGGEALTR